MTYESSDGKWRKSTYDENSNQLTYESSDGCWINQTYNEDGKLLTMEDWNGRFHTYTYYDNGKMRTQEKHIKSANLHEVYVYNEKTGDLMSFSTNNYSIEA